VSEIYWLCAFAFGIGSLCITAGNWWIVRRQRGSLLPLIGGILGILALLIAPSAALNRVWWLPAVIDVGSAPFLVWTSAWLSWQGLRRLGRDTPK
jgi:hypothetical protein